MSELLDWLNTGDLDAPALVRAAMAHLNLVSIHPWRDGNGRMSRCVQTLILAREQILAPEFSSIEAWLGQELNTLEYYQALNNTGSTWQPHRDVHDWVRFCLTAHHKQAQTVQKRVDLAARTWGAMVELAEANDLDERVVNALYAAAVGQLTRASYQRDEDLTRDQSVRDLQALKRLGLLESLGHARTQRYVAAGEAHTRAAKIFDEVRRTPLTHPYSR